MGVWGWVDDVAREAGVCSVAELCCRSSGPCRSNTC